MKAFKLSTITLSIAAALLGQSAHAVLERTGPIDTANGFPRWYQDTSGVAIELCLPLNQGEVDVASCLLGPGDPPVVPEVFPGQFFDEHFWWAAGAALTPQQAGAKASLVLALEAAFSADVAPGNQIVFSRIRVRLQPIPVDGTYRFIHPYGEESIVGTTGDRIFFTDDVGIGAPGDFSGAITGRVGPFLLPSAAPGGAEIAPIAGPVPGKLYLADPARLGPVTGSTLPPFTDSTGTLRNHNIFRIEGPPGSGLGGPGVDFIETTDFSLMGRIFTGQMPSLVVADRSTYAREAADQKVDVFATAFRTAASRLPAGVRPPGVAPVTSFYASGCGTVLDAAGNFLAYTPPMGALETLMSAQNNARWGQISIASGMPLPDSVCLKDNSAVDINGQPVPAYHPLPVNDDVKITDADFDPQTSTLTVKATSSDMLMPPTLTLTDFNAPLMGGRVTVPGVTAPPAKVRVLSAARGLGEFSVVSASSSSSGGDKVVAGNDTATTNEDTAVLIPVITGDKYKGMQIDPATQPITLAIIINGSKGTAVASNLTGAMTYTPNANANGNDAFTYTVTVDGKTSNIATVAVNITPVNDAPVAAADTAGGAVNTPLVISVLANDSDVDGDALSIVAGSVTAPAGPLGSVSNATANANGTITFTGNIAGIYQFTYRATDGMIQTAPTPVSVTLSAPEAVTAPAPEYVVSKNRWKVTGTTSIATAHTLTLKLTGLIAGGAACNAEGRVIGITTSTANTFVFDILNATGPLDPRTTNCNSIRVESAVGGISPNSLIRLK
jgi:hypothetical protein